MLAHVLTSAASWNSEQPLLTYSVPIELEDRLGPGQLVAVPYGERLVEGIAWSTDTANDEDGLELRPISAILDVEPALLAHQITLAEWMSAYYVTPLSRIAFKMLPPGLLQRSQVVLHMAKTEREEAGEGGLEKATSLRLQALVGLLLADGELDVEKLKKMLGLKRAKEVLKEALTSGIVEREAQLSSPFAKKRLKRVVRLVAQGEELAAWRQRTEARIGQYLPSTNAINIAPDNVRRFPKKSTPDPWAMTGTGDVLTLTPQDRVSLQAQRQLAAVDLLQNEMATNGNNAHYWAPSKLCKATSLTPAQLQALVRENIVAIEVVEVRRDPLQGRAIPASTPLTLTPAQERALEHILDFLALEEGSGQEYIKPILLHGVTGSGKTEVYLQALAAIIARGKRGIVLVPEIVLTTQAIERFAGRFPGRVAIIHGDLFMGERFDEWQRIRAGQVGPWIDHPRRRARASL